MGINVRLEVQFVHMIWQLQLPRMVNCRRSFACCSTPDNAAFCSCVVVLFRGMNLHCYSRTGNYKSILRISPPSKLNQDTPLSGVESRYE